MSNQLKRLTEAKTEAEKTFLLRIWNLQTMAYFHFAQAKATLAAAGLGGAK